MPQELKDLKTAIDERNYKRIGAVAHNIKSTVSYLGLHQLTPLLDQIEAECESKNGLARIHENFVLINTTCQLAIKKAQELISV